MKKRIALWLVVSLLGVPSISQNFARAEQWGDKSELQEFLGRQDVLTRIGDMNGLMSKSLPPETSPWSDTFWPDVEGSIAVPYTESKLRRWSSYPISWVTGRSAGANAWGFNRNIVADRKSLTLKTAKERHDYYLGAPQEELDNLSPSEKYDLLLGDMEFTLTHRVFEMLDVRREIPGMLTLWSGVCHGWAPASLNLPRPDHSFSVMSPLGRMVKFFPADVKALESFLWGKSYAQNSIRLKGNRCAKQDARKNKYGRLVDPDCFDTNPAFFFLLNVNQIGRKPGKDPSGKEYPHIGYIMNRAYKHEVQNQPVKGYDFKFYKTSDRPIRPGMSWEEAKVRIAGAGAKWDPFKPYRSPKAVSVVGVEATIHYQAESLPDHKERDGAWADKDEEYGLRFDLELDASGEIVGGEWREYKDVDAPTVAEQMGYKHPDFVWITPPGLKALSIADNAALDRVDWDGKTGSVPKAWKDAAIQASNNKHVDFIEGKLVTMPEPQPVAKIVDFLIKMSRQ